MKNQLFFFACLFGIVMVFITCEKKDIEPKMGSIYGVVTDKATGEPIKSAGVEVLSNGSKSITGSDGTFQFNNIEEGKYQLYITKSGYQSYTTNEITVKANSKDITHSIQLEKLPPALHIMDDAGHDLDTINFGSLEGDIMRSFNIFNNSEESLEWEIAYSSVWIKSFSKIQGILKAGATQTIVLTIDRSKIISGEVSTIAHIVSDNGSKELTILASASAVVETTEASDIDATSAILSANLLQNMEPSIVEYGFVYNKEAMPTLDNGAYKVFRTEIPQLGKYSIRIDSLIPETKYYACAYVSNGEKVVYGSQIDFTTIAHHPGANIKNISFTASTFTIEYEVHDGGAKLEEVGICWDTKSFPTKESSHYQNTGHEAKQYTNIITGLSASTTYYVRVYVRNIEEEAYSTEMTITTSDGFPIVETSNEFSTTASTITAGGNITSNGGYAITDRGVCYSTTNAQPTLTDGNVSSGKGDGEFQVSITGLSAGTTYYVRAYATNEKGTSFGETISIQTKSGNASVLLSNATNITALTASASVTVTDAGSATLQSCGICWSANPTPTIADKKITASGKTLNTAYPCNMSELQPGTTYYVRAYATTDVATTYSQQQSFTTLTGSAETTLGAISNITALTASGTVTIVNAGGATVQSCGICWATTPNPTTANQKTVASGRVLNTAYTCNLSNLNPSTVYYVRAYATTDIATSYSPQKTFTTSSGLPELTTTQPTATSVNITSGGNIISDGGYTITARGLCYSTSNSEPTLNDLYTTSGAGYGAFTSVITSVSVSTTYYVRAYATNSVGTGYGNVVVVTTGTGLPVVATTTPSLNDRIVSTGGQVVNDGGFPITSRGICYGSLPYPDLTSNYTHTNNGEGIGYFASSFEISPNSGMYYIRAYATNINGTTYGEQYTIMHPYDTLPTFTYNGKTYRVAPGPQTKNSEFITWSAANSYCENLTAYGFSDWRLPTLAELQAMYQNRESIGGWLDSYTSTSDTPCYSVYWSSDEATSTFCTPHWVVKWKDGTSTWTCDLDSEGKWWHETTPHYYYIAHVRPIRIEE